MLNYCIHNNTVSDNASVYLISPHKNLSLTEKLFLYKLQRCFLFESYEPNEKQYLKTHFILARVRTHEVDENPKVETLPLQF